MDTQRMRSRRRATPAHPTHTLATQLRLSGAPAPVAEYRLFAHHVGLGKGIKARFAAAGLRDFRYDLAYPAERVCIDVQGGGFVNGHHSRGLGMEDDCEKHSTAVALGWRVLTVTPRQVQDGRARQWVCRVLGVEPEGRELWRGIV